MKIKAFAKINLTLDILGKRADGYHNLDMLMQSVDLFDEITVNINETGVIKVNSSNRTLGGENDIVFKAAKLFLETVGSNFGAEIYVDKHIPLSAGLGGGSSDAAAVIVGLNKLCGDILNKSQMADIALFLGADVPFFLYGGTLRVTGIGEILTPVPEMPECCIVLAKESTKGSTGQMYALIDSIADLPRPDNESAVSALSENNIVKLSENLKNVFEVAYNKSDKLIAAYKNNKALCLTLSGSGPTFFGIFKNFDDANACLAELKKAKIEAYLTKPIKNPYKID